MVGLQRLSGGIWCERISDVQSGWGSWALRHKHEEYKLINYPERMVFQELNDALCLPDTTGQPKSNYIIIFIL
ncbi:hypothetical protein IO171_003905 [Salmonella enterica]|nr:hypothetical protein [Salmonella enterica]EHR3166938.1 hypothetical protein [Salmonella enterica]